jgi:DnaJ-class molecular chaperone
MGLREEYLKDLENNKNVYPTCSHSHAEVCPICHGTGKITKNFDGNGYIPTGQETITQFCHGCSGKGWVTVRD